MIKYNPRFSVCSSAKSFRLPQYFLVAWLVAGLPASIFSAVSIAQPKQINFYYSADRTGTKSSGNSMEQGIRTALAQYGNKVGDYQVQLITLNHRGSTPRSDRHLQQYLEDDKALVFFSGMHSPPLLKARQFINENEILMLCPWAAAGPITRHDSKQNWIFRLSIDDSKAGFVITDFAVKRHGIKKPALLLEETGWGKSNLSTMTKALKEHGLSPAVVKRFNWGLGEVGAKIILREIKAAGADAVFLVANAPEGEAVSQAMASLVEEYKLPIFSHWGITGGDFPKIIGPDIRSKFELHFIQTGFSFLGELNDFQQGVFQQLVSLHPESIKEPKDLQAPTGFIHAYDLTNILLSAIQQDPLTGNVIEDRRSIRKALENLKNPVTGLIKKYEKPFSEYSSENIDAHEALRKEDFVMAIYGKHNEIIIDSSFYSK